VQGVDSASEDARRRRRRLPGAARPVATRPQPSRTAARTHSGSPRHQAVAKACRVDACPRARSSRRAQPLASASNRPTTASRSPRGRPGAPRPAHELVTVLLRHPRAIRKESRICCCWASPTPLMKNLACQTAISPPSSSRPAKASMPQSPGLSRMRRTRVLSSASAAMSRANSSRAPCSFPMRAMSL
jgi:hypothetical protein